MADILIYGALWDQLDLDSERHDVIGENAVDILVQRKPANASRQLLTFTRVRIARTSGSSREQSERAADSHMPVIIGGDSTLELLPDDLFTSEPFYPGRRWRVIQEVLQHPTSTQRRYECEMVS